jgi:hypothetical protein
MYGEVWAFRKGDGTVLVKWPYADSTRLIVMACRRDGSPDPRLGRNGVASIRTPWRGRNAALETMVTVIEADSTAITIIAAYEARNQLQVIRVRLRARTRSGRLG